MTQSLYLTVLETNPALMKVIRPLCLFPIFPFCINSDCLSDKTVYQESSFFFAQIQNLWISPSSLHLRRSNIPKVTLTPSVALGSFCCRPGMQTHIHHEGTLSIVNPYPLLWASGQLVEIYSLFLLLLF